jgi:hypothetical protein
MSASNTHNEPIQNASKHQEEVILSEGGEKYPAQSSVGFSCQAPERAVWPRLELDRTHATNRRKRLMLRR